MKVIGFSAGVVGRESNVDRMVKAIMNKSGHDAEFVKLTDLTYSGCKGCVELCAAPKQCMLEDDLLPYYAKVKEADAVVIGTPVYFATVTATITAFLERFFGYRHVMMAIKDKPFVVAVIGCGMLDKAKEHALAKLAPFEVDVLDVVQYASTVFPCYSCRMHRICEIGGLYRFMGEDAHQLEITPELFRVWEDDPDAVAAVAAAAEKLKAL